MLLIKGGRVVDPVSGTDRQMDILIRDGRILWIGDSIVPELPGTEQMTELAKIAETAQPQGSAEKPETEQIAKKEKMEEKAQPQESAKMPETAQIPEVAKILEMLEKAEVPVTPEALAASQAPDEELQILDASGLVVAPGLVDVHVHFRDPGYTYKEDIETGAAAAAKGGFTTVICMANTRPPVDNVETLRYVLEKGAGTGIHVLTAAAVTRQLKGKELTDMEALAQAGAAGFTDDGIPILDQEILVKAMEMAKRLDLPISLHEEDPAFIQAPGVHQGRVAEAMGYGGASRTAEDVMVARDCALALHTGASVCIQHISSGNAVEFVRAAKNLGADVHAEATPHHFTLTEDAVETYGTLARMNPPLRTEADRQKIIEGLKDHTIDMIVTDHAPHSTEEKARSMGSAPSGITGLETSLGLGIRSLVEPGHLSLLELMACMSKNPMEFYRKKPVSVAPGNPADLVIFGEKETWKVEHFASKAQNSPFKNWTLPGKIHYTICGGTIVYENGGL